MFTRNSLYEILRNEKYTGTFVYNKMESRDEFSGVRSRHKYKPENEIIKVENMIPEIISKEDWKSVQTILNRRKKAYTIMLKKNTCSQVKLNAVNAVAIMLVSVPLIAEE